MDKKLDKVTARYFGLKVDVVEKMSKCSLIRFQGREYIVDTVDLVFTRHLKCVA
jgi:hypothetical protein